jgi:hypothetical protein
MAAALTRVATRSLARMLDTCMLAVLGRGRTAATATTSSRCSAPGCLLALESSSTSRAPLRARSWCPHGRPTSARLSACSTSRDAASPASRTIPGWRLPRQRSRVHAGRRPNSDGAVCGSDGGQVLEQGVALARAVGAELRPIAYVLTSAAPRAIETAIAMGVAVDDTVDLPSGYVPGEVGFHEQWTWAQPWVRYAELGGRGGGLAAATRAHQAAWTRVVAAVADDATALVVSTAAQSSRRWWPASPTPTTSSGAHCWPIVTAPAWGSRTALSSTSASAERRPRRRPPRGPGRERPSCQGKVYGAPEHHTRRTRSSS